MLDTAFGSQLQRVSKADPPARLRLSAVTFAIVDGRGKDVLMRFDAGARDCALLGSGSNRPERNGTWPRTGRAVISWMAEDEIPSGTPITVFGWCIDPPQQTLHASINGTPIEQADSDTSEPVSLAFPDRIPAGDIGAIQLSCTPVVRAAALGYNDDHDLGCFVSAIAVGRASTESLEDKRTLVPLGPVNKALPSILQRITGRRPQASR